MFKKRIAQNYAFGAKKHKRKRVVEEKTFKDKGMCFCGANIMLDILLYSWTTRRSGSGVHLTKQVKFRHAF